MKKILSVLIMMLFANLSFAKRNGNDVQYAILYYLPLCLSTYDSYDEYNVINDRYTESKIIRNRKSKHIYSRLIYVSKEKRQFVSCKGSLNLRVVVEFFDQKKNCIDFCGFSNSGNLKYQGECFDRDEELIQMLEKNVEKLKFFHVAK